MPGIKTVLVRKLAPVVFETVSDPSINGWCGNEILRAFNIIIQNSDKNMRNELIADNNLMHLYVLRVFYTPKMVVLSKFSVLD